MGDLNFQPDEPPYSIILKNGFSDSFAGEYECTFTGFDEKDADCKRIDYIFTNDDFKVKQFSIDSRNDGTYFPSDHLPVIIDANF